MLRLESALGEFVLPTCIKNDEGLPNVLAEIVNKDVSIRTLLDANGWTATTDLYEMVLSLSQLTQPNEKEIQLELLRSEMPSYITSFDQSANAYLTKITNNKAQLENLSTSNNILNESIEALKYLVDYISQNELDNNELSEVNAISEYCSDQYGSYVHVARAISNQVSSVYFDDFDSCLEGGEQLRKANGKVSRVLIYTNPSSSGVYLEFDQREQAKYDIINMNGKTMTSGRIEGVSYSFLDLDLPSGMYIVRITFAEEKEEFLKLVIK